MTAMTFTALLADERYEGKMEGLAEGKAEGRNVSWHSVLYAQSRS